MALRNKRNSGSAEISSAAEATASQITSQINALRARIEDLTETLAESGETHARDAARHARAAAKNAVHGAERGYELAADRALEARDAAAKLTSERPGMALGLAVGFGLLAGILLTRRSD